jgi:hypothetical protein
LPSLVDRITSLTQAIGARIKLLENRPLFRGVMTVAQTVTGQTYTTLNIVSSSDTHAAFDSTSKYYIVPQTGWYNITARARLADGLLSGAVYGLGIDTVNQDSIYMKWETSTSAVLGSNKRVNVLNERFMYLTQGSAFRAYIYVDMAGTYSVSNAELTIVRIR